MPNIACSTDHGAVIYYSYSNKSSIMEDLFSPNLVKSVNDDNAVNVATLLSACLPAFYAWYNEQLKSILCGYMSENEINPIMAQTMIGTGYLLKDYNNNQIIKMVASPQGATEATLASFETGNVAKEIHQALSIAKERIDTMVCRS